MKIKPSQKFPNLQYKSQPLVGQYTVQCTVDSLTGSPWEKKLNLELSVFPGLELTSNQYMGLDVTKPVFGVSDKASFKPACSATGTN